MKGKIISDPREIRAAMEGRLDYLEELQKMCGDNIKRAPEGSLRAYRHGEGYQYAHQPEGRERKSIYIPKSRRDFAVALAQKDYDQKLLLSAAAEIKALENALFLYPDRPVEDVYDSLPEAKKVLLEPFHETDEQFVQKWMSEVYEGNPFYDVSTGFETEQGEIVRSKSEWMLANIFHQAGIPYRYEYPLRLGAFGIVYPDFTVLNVRLRKERRWEHFGLMDDPEYAEKAVRKINAYQAAGYYPGEDLIITMETKNQPLDVRLVKKLIEKYCL